MLSDFTGFIRNELPTSIQRMHKYGKDPKTQQEAPHHRFQMESYKLGQQQKLEEDPILSTIFTTNQLLLATASNNHTPNRHQRKLFI